MNGFSGDNRHHRKSIRLRGYDYSRAGAYFVTICTHNRTPLFGDIVNGEMRLDDAGQLVQRTWEGLPRHYSHAELDAFVIMPNHIHGIIVLTPTPVGEGFKPAPTAMTTPAPAATRHSLAEIIRGFKTFSARGFNELRSTPGIPLWQRNYYEHIIRNDAALDRIRQYIMDNPARWHEDPENPATGRDRATDTATGRGRFQTCPYGDPT